MHIRLGIFAIALAASLAWLAPAPARAAEPVVVQAADGWFVHAESGTRAPTKEGVLAMLAGLAPNAAALPEPVPTPADAPAPAAPPSLRSAVVRARTMLSEKIASEDAKRKSVRIVAGTNAWVDVTLAVWNAKTDAIRLVSFKKNGAKVKIDSPDAADVLVRRSNGVNSEFVLKDADDYPVAVQYPSFKERWVKKQRSYELHDVVYTPWSERLQTPEVVAWGEETLDGYIDAAYADLRVRGVKSRAYPNRLLADVIDPALVKSIVTIEHVSLPVTERNPRFAVESVQVIIAGNQESSYAFSRSSAGALGLVQFIPSTYKLMTNRKDLGLIKDFEKGMRDPKNAITATVGYLDAELATMPLSIKDLYYVDPTKVNEYLAASYNGGSGRIRKAVRAWGEHWSDDHADEISAAMAEHDRLIDRGEAVKAQIRKGPDAKSLKKLNAELVDIRVKYRALRAKAQHYRDTSIRAETSQYIEKLRLVMPIFKPQVPVILASAQ